jgi:hypothetical protein
MANRRHNKEALLIALLLFSFASNDDPFFAEYLYKKFREKLKKPESPDPQLDKLLHKYLH